MTNKRLSFFWAGGVGAIAPLALVALLAPGADWPTFWAKLFVERYT